MARSLESVDHHAPLLHCVPLLTKVLGQLKDISKMQSLFVIDYCISLVFQEPQSEIKIDILGCVNRHGEYFLTGSKIIHFVSPLSVNVIVGCFPSSLLNKSMFVQHGTHWNI